MARYLTTLVAVCVLSLVTATQAKAAPTAQVEFFERVASGKVENLLAVMHPELQREIDAPVLEAWVTAFNSQLGAVREIQLASWTRRPAPAGTVVQTKCKLACEQGEANSELTVLDGKVIGFDITSDRLQDFLDHNASTEIYEQLGEQFIQHFLAGEAEAAHALCHSALQEVVSLAELKQMIDRVGAHVGSPTEIKVVGIRMEFTEEADNLFLDYEITGSLAAATCAIKIEFVGLKGHLLGFDFN